MPGYEPVGRGFESCQARQIKTHPRGGFLFGYMMEDSNRGSYTRRKPRARYFFLVYFVKRNAVSCQARHVVAGFAKLATVFIFHMYLKTSLRSRRFFDCSFSGKQCARMGSAIRSLYPKREFLPMKETLL